MIFELTLAPVSNIFVYSDVTKAHKYNLTNMDIEYQYITSDYLTQETLSSYQVGKEFFYEIIIFHKIFTIMQ